MSKNFLLVEAVNIYKAVYDTDQLSVIRGTSFLLKNAITSVRDNFSQSLTAVSSGASSGLFIVNEPYSVAEITEQIVAYLQQHRHYRLLPILVEYCTATDLLQAKQQLLTQLRFTQMHCKPCAKTCCKACSTKYTPLSASARCLPQPVKFALKPCSWAGTKCCL